MAKEVSQPVDALFKHIANVALRCVLLTIVIAALSACFRPGGGGLYHTPPSHAEFDKPTRLSLKLTPWGDDPAAIARTWRDVRVHYRLIGDDRWIELPVTVGDPIGATVLAHVDIPPFTKSDREGFEYFFTFTLGSVHQSIGDSTASHSSGPTQVVPVRVPFVNNGQDNSATSGASNGS